MKNFHKDHPYLSIASYIILSLHRESLYNNSEIHKGKIFVKYSHALNHAQRNEEIWDYILLWMPNAKLEVYNKCRLSL